MASRGAPGDRRERQPLRDRMDKARVDEADVLAAARQHHGLAHMAQIKYAVLERSGGTSIVPCEDRDQHAGDDPSGAFPVFLAGVELLLH
jgi:uncharacterized membrane protein YcaP (DUF421 family)